MKKKILSIAAVAVMSVMIFSGCGTDAADTLIQGTVYTGDKEGTVAQAVAVKDGEITYVGDEKGAQEYVDDNTQVIKTEDGMALPSFMDGHAHGQEGGVGYLFEANLYEDASVKEYQATLKQFIKEHPDLDFINGAGWINGYIPKDGNYAALLDQVSKDLPIALVSGDHHSFWLNSKAMEQMGINKDTKDVSGGVITRDSKGNPTGLFRETAQDIVKAKIPEYSVDQYKQGIQAYQEEVMAYGITVYFEPMVNLNGRYNILKAYNEMDKAGELKIRVYGGYQINDDGNQLADLDKAEEAIKEAEGGDFEITAIKLLVDGVIEGHTAYLLESYADSKDRGEALWKQKDLNEFCTAAAEKGITVHAHAIGDAAVKMTVDAYETAQKESGNKDTRQCITHLQIVDKVDIERMGKLGIVASTDPYWFCKEPGYFEELETPYLGKTRADNEYPMKDFFDADCVVTAASDFPVTMPAKPLEAIQTGVTRCAIDGDKATFLGADQRVTVDQMIKAFTYNNAYQVFAEDTFGSLEVGKSADMIVVDKDITKSDSFEIASAKVQKTILKGKTIYDSSK